MTSAYPNDLDNFTNPTSLDKLSSVTVPHWTEHANINDAIEAIEGELGIVPSGSHSTVKDRLQSIEDDLSALGGTVFGALPDGIVTNAKLATDSVDEDNLQAGSVSVNKLKTDSVTTDKIVNLAVTGSKIAEATIGYSKHSAFDKCWLKRTSSQSLTGINSDYISFNVTSEDTAGYTSASPTTTVTIPAAHGGIYAINGQVEGFTNNSSDYVRITTSDIDFSAGVSGGYGNVSGIVELAAGDTVKLYVHNGSSNTLSLTGQLYLIKLANV